MLPTDSGIIIPKTKDGRLIFVINYLGNTMVGTTDEKTEISHTVGPDQTEIDFITSELRQVFGENYDYQGNLLSAWSGTRPLVKETEEDVRRKAEYLGIETDPAKKTYRQLMRERFQDSVVRLGARIHNKKGATSAISRNHVIEFS